MQSRLKALGGGRLEEFQLVSQALGNSLHTTTEITLSLVGNLYNIIVSMHTLVIALAQSLC